MFVASSFSGFQYHFMSSHVLDEGKQSKIYQCFKEDTVYAMKVYSEQANKDDINK